MSEADLQIEELLREATKARERAEDVLADALNAIRNGLEPTSELEVSVDLFRSKLRDASIKLASIAERLGVPPAAALDLNLLHTQFAFLRELEAHQKNKIAETAGAVLRLRHRQPDKAGELEPAYSAGRDLAEGKIADLEWLKALIALVDKPDPGITDSEARANAARLVQKVNPNLAVSALLGDLYIEGASEEIVDEVAHPEETDEAYPLQADLPHALLDPDHDVITPAPPAVEANLPSEATTEEIASTQPLHHQDDVDAQHTAEPEESADDSIGITGDVPKPELSISTPPAISQLGAEELARISLRLLTQGHSGLAYLICRSAEHSGVEPPVPSDLIAAAVTGQHLLSAYGQLAEELRFRLSSLSGLGTENTPWGRSRGLLLLAANARAALIDPRSGAGALLRRAPLDGEFRAIADLIVEYGDRLRGVEAHILSGLHEEVSWKQELDGVTKSAQDFLKSAPHMSIIYAPTTNLWKHWLKEGNFIERLMGPVARNDVSQLATVESWLYDLTLERVHDQIDNDDTTLRGKAAKRIEATARETLVRKIDAAVEKARTWVRLHRQHPDRPDYLHEQVVRLYQGLEGRVRELADYPPQQLEGGEEIWRWACARLRDTVALFRAVPSEPEPDKDWVKVALLSPLLRLPALEIDASWEPKTYEGLLPQLIGLVDQEADWEGLFRDSLKRRDLLRAEHLLAIIGLREDLSILHSRAIQDNRITLREVLVRTRNKLELSLMGGVLTADQRNALDARLEKVKRRFLPEGRAAAGDLRFDQAHVELEAISGLMDEYRSQRVEELTRKLDGDDLRDSPVYARARAALEAGDLLTASEYINQPNDDLQADPPSQQDIFAEFVRLFPSLNKHLSGESERQIIYAVRNRQKVGELDLSSLSDHRSLEAAELLEEWFKLKRERKYSANSLRKVVEGLGFSAPNLTEHRKAQNSQWVRLRCQTVSDRADCPIPAFGSEARGAYQLLLTWNMPTEDWLLTEANAANLTEPIIVLYFGRLPEERRRNLAMLARTQHQKKYRNLLVLDDLLLVFLCGERLRRLPALFYCTLPYTLAEPYITTAGAPPKEMFYGRQRERDELLRPGGSNFVYGGRQLGKTALLRTIESEEHRPAEGRVVRYVDLLNYSTNRAWDLIHDALLKEGVVRGNPKGPRSQWLLGEVRRWIEGGPNRRVLLLLDEADAFLESDLKERYGSVAGLKQLMEATQQRFRFVLSGLHNVVRTARDPNHPLGHLGVPILIGPMIEGLERREARDLIENPLRAMGYRLKEEQTLRILGLTNYYPSLIQLFGYFLLRRLVEQARQLQGGPPWDVPDRILDEAYQSIDLQEAIRRRFSMTLELDQRYNVIANIIALDVLEGSIGLEDGYRAQLLLDKAKGYWSEGFGNTTLEAFEAILAEMVDLGVLRRVNGRNYTLRSQNLLYLMGTLDEICEQLIRPRELPRLFEPSSYRSEIPARVGSDKIPSPLTALQERAVEEATGIVFIVGSKGLGSADLPEALKRPGEVSRGLDEWHFHPCRSADPSSFEREITEVAQKRRRGTTVIYVSDDAPWSEVWVDRARRVLGRYWSKDKPIRVVFLVDPATLWRQGDLIASAESGDGTVLNLQPWSQAQLVQWLDSAGSGLRQTDAGALVKAAGGMPLLIQYLVRAAPVLTPDGRSAPEALRNWVRDHRKDVCSWVGLDTLPGQVVLDMARMISVLDPLSEHEMASFPEFEGKPIRDLVRWGERLALLRRVGERWDITSVVAELVG